MFKKRLLSAALSFTLVLGISGCGNTKNTDTRDTSTESSTEVSTEIITEVVTETSADPKPATEMVKVEAEDDNYRNYYEIFVRSYADSDGDHIGDLNGVTSKLDYIADLGINGIWFMPVTQSTTYHKYDVVDYRSIDREYGTMEDFDKLIEEAHKRGIRVIIDLVINHTSSQNEWFKSACEYLKELGDNEPNVEDCKYFGYYNFSKKMENGSYYKVPGTDWYYEGSFWSEMPDLNLKNETLMAEIKDIADFWMEHGVDGFRMDAALHFEESDTAANNEILNELFNYCKEKNPDFYMVSEVWADQSTIASYYGSLTPSMFNFAVSGGEGPIVKAGRGKYSAERFVNAMLKSEELYSAVNPDFIDAPFISNHDQPRVSNNLNGKTDDMKYAGGLLLSMGGSPFVYYGEEIGMASAGQKDENKRLPMVWSKDDTTGITNAPTGADKIEQDIDGVDKQLKDEGSLLNYYKKALRIRNENPEIARGRLSIVESLTKDDQAAIIRTWNDKKIAVIYNTDDVSFEMDLAGTELENFKVVASLTLDGSEVTLNGTKITLPARSIIYLK